MRARGRFNFPRSRAVKALLIVPLGECVYIVRVQQTYGPSGRDG